MNTKPISAVAELHERIKAEIRRRLAECIERQMRSNGTRLDMDLIACCIHCAAEGVAFDWTIDSLIQTVPISPLEGAQAQGKVKKMGWKWCSGEPTFHIDGRPVQLTVRIPREFLEKVKAVDVRAALPLGVTAEIVQGQAQKKILGVDYSFDAMNTDDESAIGFSVLVTTDNPDQSFPIIAELHDPRGAVTGNRLALGETNEWVFIDGTIEQA